MSQLLTRAVCALALVGFLVSALAVPAARAEDRDCADFGNQQEAQDYFVERGGPSSDPDLLDGDDDGAACDSLPCPCSSGPSPQPRPVGRAQAIRARVTEVIDGDTIRVKSLEATGPARYTVRLIGIDTPEVYGGIECGGRQASAHMKRIAPAGRRVLLRTDPTQATFDRYDRLLAYVKLRGGPGRGDLPVASGPGDGLCLWRKPLPAGAIVPPDPAVGTRGRAGCVGHVRRQLPSRARAAVARLGRLAGRESGREGHLTAMSCRKFPSRTRQHVHERPAFEVRRGHWVAGRPSGRGGRVRAETSERQEETCEQASGSWS